MDIKRRDVDIIMKNNGYLLHHMKGSRAIYRNDCGQHISIDKNTRSWARLQRLSKVHNLTLKL